MEQERCRTSKSGKNREKNLHHRCPSSSRYPFSGALAGKSSQRARERRRGAPGPKEDDPMERARRKEEPGEGPEGSALLGPALE